MDLSHSHCGNERWAGAGDGPQASMLVAARLPDRHRRSELTSEGRPWIYPIQPWERARAGPRNVFQASVLVSARSPDRHRRSELTSQVRPWTCTIPTVGISEGSGLATGLKPRCWSLPGHLTAIDGAC